MPAITLAGHLSKGHEGFPARPSIEGCSRVTVGGVPVHCEGHAWADHGHIGYLAQGAPHVTIAGRGVGRIGDPITCGDTVAQGCRNVTVGNCGGADFARDIMFESLTDPKDKLILCLPEMEAAMAEQLEPGPDKQGWVQASECAQKWMNKKAYTIRGSIDNGGQTPYLVEWEWLLNYFRFQRALTELLIRDNLFHLNARANLNRFLEQEGAFASEGRTFDHITLPLMELRARAFQSQPMKYDLTEAVVSNGGNPVPDGMQACIAQTTLFAVAAGETQINGGVRSVIVRRVGGFIHDAYDFSDDQWLGNWICSPEKKGFSPLMGTPLHNRAFRNFREQTGYGCDFRIMCIPHVVWKGEFRYDLA